MHFIRSAVDKSVAEMTDLNHKDPVGKKLVFGFASVMTVMALAAITAGVLHHYNQFPNAFEQFPMSSNPMMDKILIGGGAGFLAVEAVVGGFFGWSQSKVRSQIDMIEREAEGGKTQFFVPRHLVRPVQNRLKEKYVITSAGRESEIATISLERREVKTVESKKEKIEQ